MPSNSQYKDVEPFIYRFIPQWKVQETSSTVDIHKLTQDTTSLCKHQLMSSNEENAQVCYASASITDKTEEWDLHLGPLLTPFLNRPTRPVGTAHAISCGTSQLKIYTTESENMPYPQPGKSLHTLQFLGGMYSQISKEFSLQKWKSQITLFKWNAAVVNLQIAESWQQYQDLKGHPQICSYLKNVWWNPTGGR